MSDKVLSDALAALARSQLTMVEVLREMQSTQQVMSARLGRFCDDMGEFADKTNSALRDSERSIRVLQTDTADVKRRLSKLESVQGIIPPPPRPAKP